MKAYTARRWCYRPNRNPVLSVFSSHRHFKTLNTNAKVPRILLLSLNYVHLSYIFTFFCSISHVLGSFTLFFKSDISTCSFNTHKVYQNLRHSNYEIKTIPLNQQQLCMHCFFFALQYIEGFIHSLVLFDCERVL